MCLLQSEISTQTTGALTKDLKLTRMPISHLSTQGNRLHVDLIYSSLVHCSFYTLEYVTPGPVASVANCVNY